MSNTGRLTEQKYWDGLYVDRPESIPIKIDTNNMLAQRLRRLYDRYFLNMENKELLEVGCALSKELILLRELYGFNASGIDYSEVGVKKMIAWLKHNNYDIGGQIRQQDVFEDNIRMNGKYDIVTSYGFIEHFEDMTLLLSRMKNYLKENGIMFTLVPNTTNMNFSIIKQLDREIYDMHNKINREYLQKVHEDAGLEVQYCDYFGTINFGILSCIRSQNKIWKAVFWLVMKGQRILHRLLTILSYYPETPKLSPYIICFASKKAA